MLSEDEKEIGVAVVDIGGGTTDILLYVDGGIAHTSVIPVGGNNITSDIAAGLRTPMAEADRLKRLSGCALGRMVADDEEIEVPGVGGHAPRKTARRVLRTSSSRASRRSSPSCASASRTPGMLEQLSAGVVLTGGAVLLQGMSEFAEEILGMPVRVGMPTGIKGITQLVHGPEYATGVGLVKYGALAVSGDAAPLPAIQRRVGCRAQRLVSQSSPVGGGRGRASASGFWEWIKAGLLRV